MNSDSSLDSREVMTAASLMAREAGHAQVTAGHVLLSLQRLRTAVGDALAALGVTGPAVLAAAAPGPEAAAGPRLTAAATSVLLTAQRDAATGTPADVALLQACLTSGDPSVDAVLAAASVTREQVLNAATAPHSQMAPLSAADDTDTLTPPTAAPLPATYEQSAPASPMAALTQFGSDMLARARAGAFDPVIGRERELERVVTILARRSKNNPVLLGEPGVGKSAVVEALATKMAAGDLEPVLGQRPLIELDLAGMLAGARLRGDFEGRVKDLLAAAETCRAILFIDEIHTLVGAGATTGGAGLSEMLKPVMARGQVTVLGATTLQEYRTSIETDAALERRFAPVAVHAPSLAQTVTILDGLAGRFGAHHGVTYTPAALSAAARLTDQYVPERHLPDKAIDVIDEAGAVAAMAMARAGADAPLYTRRRRLRADAHTGDATRAAVCAREERALTAQLSGRDLGVVDEDAIAALVAASTGIPLAALDQAGAAALAELPQRLAARVIGQAEAVAAVSAAVRRHRTGISAGTRPASFLFAGPTGVGKSQLAKALAEELFADGSGRSRLVQVDMGEYAEKSSTARLFGAPPGYVGHDAGGQLTEAVRRQRHCVVLFDEVEKAHPEVFDALLQVLEDGRMTDGTGRTVDFSNTIVVMTTNLGASTGARTAGFGTRPGADTAAVAQRALAEHFRPEFLNRIDQVVHFAPLTRDDMAAVLQVVLAPLREQLAARSLTLELTPAAAAVVLAAGWDPQMGARPLRRAVQRMLTDPLADLIMSGQATPGTHLVVEGGDGAVLIRTERSVNLSEASSAPSFVEALG